MPAEISVGLGAVANGPRPQTSILAAGFKEGCRRIIAGGLYHTGLLGGVRQIAQTHHLISMAGSPLPQFRRLAASKFGILCYHRVGKEGIPLFSRLDPRVFEAQMRYVSKHYRIISLRQLCLEIGQNRSLKPSLAITFDDGYRDLYTHAFPVLRKYGIPATIYLIGRCMATGEAPWYDRIFLALSVAPGPSLVTRLNTVRQFELSSPAARAEAAWQLVCYLRTIPDALRREWCSDFEMNLQLPQDALRDRMLDWEQARTMQRAGIDFGAHTMTHPVVAQLAPDDFQEELTNARLLLEKGLGRPVTDFAYPFGKFMDFAPAAEEFLTRSGYRSAVTTIEGVNVAGSNLFSLRRTQVGDGFSLSMFAFNVARMFLDGETDALTRQPAASTSHMRGQA